MATRQRYQTLKWSYFSLFYLPFHTFIKTVYKFHYGYLEGLPLKNCFQDRAVTESRLKVPLKLYARKVLTFKCERNHSDGLDDCINILIIIIKTLFRPESKTKIRGQYLPLNDSEAKNDKTSCQLRHEMKVFVFRPQHNLI